jgi:hypothetical protein
MTGLVLKRASASRPSGEWNDDDYDVLADGVVVGRIMKAAASCHGCGRSPLGTTRKSWRLAEPLQLEPRHDHQANRYLAGRAADITRAKGTRHHHALCDRSGDA